MVSKKLSQILPALSKVPDSYTTMVSIPLSSFSNIDIVKIADFNLDFVILQAESLSKMNDDAAELTNPEEMLQEVQIKYESLQKRLSREFYEKYHDWRKMRDGGGGANDEDDKTLMEFDVSKLAPYLEERNLTPGFKQKFQEWQKLKGLSLSPTRTKINKNENPNTLKKSKSDWHKWRPGSKSESNVLRFLDKEQGELRWSYFYIGCKQISKGCNSVGVLEGKPNPPEKKELAWLEKELQKVAREKQRLEKEKEKYAERETRLVDVFLFELVMGLESQKFLFSGEAKNCFMR